MQYNANKNPRNTMICHHLNHPIIDLPHGTDHRVGMRSNGAWRIVLVRGFPAYYCQHCLTILTDLSWDLAAQRALEQRATAGVAIPDLLDFADLGIDQPAMLCAS